MEWKGNKERRGERERKGEERGEGRGGEEEEYRPQRLACLMKLSPERGVVLTDRQ